MSTPRNHRILSGIHHITVLAGDPRSNVDFYTRVLGLRLVKRTVNFDAPDVYHLYYGDTMGSPGTLLTFFPFPHAARGQRGTGEIGAVALRVPVRSMDFWIRHMSRHGIVFQGPESRFNEDVIAFPDPDGLMIELVFRDDHETESLWDQNPLGEHAPDRIQGVSLWVQDPTETLDLLGFMGFRFGPEQKGYKRLFVGNGEASAAVDVLSKPGIDRGRQSAGSVHHIAWRVPDENDQVTWRDMLLERGLHVTEVLDRKYFQSVYFREPGGVLFELATDGPGMLIDEPAGSLGSRLMLPPWFEDRRGRIEQSLPPLTESELPTKG